MRPHDTFLELAATALDYPLARADRGRLEEHLAGCHACARSAAELHADAIALGDLPRVTLPERRGAEILAAALRPDAVRHPMRLAAIVALLALLLVGSLAAGAQLFHPDRHDLSVVVPAPTPTPQLTAIPAPSADAVPAPDRMAVTQQVDGADWIALVGLDQSVTPLVQGRDPAWLSADTIVYFCPTSSPDFLGLCTVDPASPESVHPLVADADRPAPAPDGGSIAFHRGTIDVGETWIIAPDGSGLRRLSSGAFGQWSPDGAWLAGQPESAAFEVAIVRADGSGLRVLAPGYDPAWSPDGTAIAYLFVDGQGATVRAVDVATAESKVRYVAPGGAELAAPAWLPDGALVFVQDGDLWRLGGDSTTPVRLSTGLAIPAVSPGVPLEVSKDGAWIAYAGGSGADATVGIASAAGDTQIAVTGSGPLTQPRWAPEPAPAPSESATPGSPSPRSSGAAGPLGVTWVPATVPLLADRPIGRIENVTAGGPGFVAVGRGCVGDAPDCEAVVLTSVDGSSWQRVPASDALATGSLVPTSGPELGMFDVAAGRDGLVAIGYAARPRMQATAWFSNDGSTWERAPLGDTGASRVNAVAWDGTSWVIVGEDRGDWDGTLEGLATASARAAAWTSPDGGTWTRVPDAPALEVGRFIDTLEDPTTGGMSDVVAGPGGIVAVGSVCHPRPAGCVPAAWTSPDGTTWQRSIGVPAIPGVLGTVATSGSGYVAAGPSLILASPDGRAWVRQPFDGPDLGTVTWMGDRYFATAVAGPRIAWASTDGSAWAAADVRGGPTADGTSVGDVWRLGATPQTAIWFGMSSDTGDQEAWVSGAGAGP